ncbi:MAG: glycerophosphodiester phosphodiesterase [Thermoproteota archaeon]
MRLVLVIAHRGASGHFPENTMKSIERAIGLGSNIVEIDLRSTRDNHVVLIHDEFVDRTTNGHGKVRDLTLNQLRTLDAGVGEKIPVLTEVFDRFKMSDIVFMLDIVETGFEQQVVDLVKRFNFERRTIFSGAHAPLISIKSIDPKLKIAPSFDKASREGVDIAKRMGAEMYNCNYRSISKEVVEEAHRAGLDVIVWVVNEVDSMRRMIEMGVDGITTNYPEVLFDLVGPISNKNVSTL